MTEIERLERETHAIKEAIFAVDSLKPPFTFDVLADAAEVLARAAMRLVPDGHGIRVERW